MNDRQDVRDHPADSVDLPRVPLSELRDYRTRLREEEDRVSYWRRLVHARIDLLRAGRGDDQALGLDQVVRALGDTGTGQRRAALHRVRAFDPLPELPVLAEVWDAPGTAAPTGPAAPDQAAQADRVEQQVARLAAAADQLSAYRTALHARIDAATAELIDRYRREPVLALSALEPAGTRER